MQIAIFGGTFDPIHIGHLMVAEQVRQIFNFGQVIFMPSAIPPHKPENTCVSARKRFKMVTLAIMSNPYFKVSSLEIDRQGPSYTVDTLRELHKSLGTETDIFFLAGSDALWEMETWREAERLFELCRFVIIHRPGGTKAEILKQLQSSFFRRVENLNPQIIRVPFCSSPINRGTTIAEEQRIDFTARMFLVEAISVDVSSSAIRKLCAQGKSIKYLVPEPVEDYISKHKLYSECSCPIHRAECSVPDKSGNYRGDLP